MILRERITLIAPADPPTDPYGNPYPPEEIGTFPAEVVPLSADEIALYDAAEHRMKVIFRFDQPIGSAWELQWLGNTWHFDSAAIAHRLNGRTHHVEAVVRRID